jgi:hypothetical protein
MNPQATDPVKLSVSTFTKIDPSLEAALLSFYGWLGLTDVYWYRLRRAFREPAVVVCAHRSDWPKQHSPDSFRAVIYGRPHDRKTAELSPLFVGNQHKIDVGIMAAVYHGAFNALLKVGMERLRFEIPSSFAMLRRQLTNVGFLPAQESDYEAIVRMDAPIKVVLEKFGLVHAKPEELLAQDFGSLAKHDPLVTTITALQLASVRRPAGWVINPGIFASPDGGTPEPGIPDPPDGGTPEPGVPSPPEPPPPGPDGGFILRTKLGMSKRTRG